MTWKVWELLSYFEGQIFSLLNHPGLIWKHRCERKGLSSTKNTLLPSIAISPKERARYFSRRPWHIHESKTKASILKRADGEGLPLQWLRLCQPMQETGVRSLVLEDPTCQGAAKPMCHSYWSLSALGPMLGNKRGYQWEDWIARKSSPPLTATGESLCMAVKIHHSLK